MCDFTFSEFSFVLYSVWAPFVLFQLVSMLATVLMVSWKVSRRDSISGFPVPFPALGPTAKHLLEDLLVRDRFFPCCFGGGCNED